MARRKKSWTKRIVVLSVLGLAIFGGYTLYDNNRTEVGNMQVKVTNGFDKAGKAIKAVKKEFNKNAKKENKKQQERYVIK